MDPVAALIMGCGLLILSALAHLMARQAGSGTLERNSAIGIRTRATQSSDAAWAAGHRAAGPWLLVTAVTGYSTAALGIAGTLVALAVGGTNVIGPIIAGSGYVAVITLLILSTGKANAAARGTAPH